MISIKKFLEQRRSADSSGVLDASLQMGRLLLEAIATHVVHGRDTDLKAFARILKVQLRKLDSPPSALHLLEISSETAEVWLLFTLMLFVAEPLFLHRYFHARALVAPEPTFRLVERLHRLLLALSVLTVLGAVAGSHGFLPF